MMPRDGNPDPDDAPPPTSPPAASHPRVDVSAALHEAGHEVHDLGSEGIPDDGPVVHPELAVETLADPLDFVNIQLPSD